MTNMTMKTCLLTALLFLCGAMAGVQAQVMKAADLEKYAKEKYGDKWLDAAANLAKDIKFDKNQSLTYQQVIEAPGKTKQQLYVMLNYWVTATFTRSPAVSSSRRPSMPLPTIPVPYSDILSTSPPSSGLTLKKVRYA